MLHKNIRFFILLFLCAALIPLTGVRTVFAGACSIPELNVYPSGTQIHVHWKVECPGGAIGGVRALTTKDGKVVYEETVGSKDFDFTPSSNGHDDLRVEVHAPSEDWSQATSSTVGFDWYGGGPTPVPPPPGYEVSISIAVSPTNVPPGSQVRITVQAACSNTTVRAIRVFADGSEINQLGSPTVTTTWSTNQVGTHTISAEAACSGDDQWKTSPGASVTINVQQGIAPSGGDSSTGGTGGQSGGNQSGGNQGGSSGGNSGGSIPEARQDHTPGGVDLIIVTYRYGYANVQNFGGADDWYWIRSNGDRVKVDFNQVCRDVYGSNSYAQKINNSAGGWRCVQGSGGGSSDGNGGGGNPPPSYDNNCPGTPSRLYVGAIALVSDYDPYDLKVWDNPNYNDPVIFGVPIREPVTIIEIFGCRDGRYWVKVGWNGRQGYAQEITIKGSYNLIPNGQSLPGQGGSNQNGGQDGNGSGGSSPQRVEPKQPGDSQKSKEHQAPFQPSQPEQPQQEPATPPPAPKEPEIKEAQGLFPEPAQGTYIKAPLNTEVLLYDGPSKGARIVGKLRQGMYYPVLFYEQGGWMSVNTDLGRGWVFDESLEVTKKIGTTSEQRQKSLEKLSLFAYCPIDPRRFAMDKMFDPTDLFITHGPTSIIREVIESLLNAIGLTTKFAGAIKEPFPDEVTLYYWVGDRGSKYLELVEKRGGKILSSSAWLDYSFDIEPGSGCRTIV